MVNILPFSILFFNAVTALPKTYLVEVADKGAGSSGRDYSLDQDPGISGADYAGEPEGRVLNFISHTVVTHGCDVMSSVDLW